MTENQRTISIVKWHKYQGDKIKKLGEDAKWCKLYNSTLLSRTWRMGSDQDRVVMIVLLMLATKFDNKIPNDPEYITDVGGISPPVVSISGDEIIGDALNLDHFFGTGFICFTDELPEEEEIESKKVERKIKPDLYRKKHAAELTRFDDFYGHDGGEKIYPKKQQRFEAERAWVNNGCNEIADKIIDHLKARLRAGWKREEIEQGNDRMIPMPATYLNKLMYEDDLPNAPQSSRERTRPISDT